MSKEHEKLMTDFHRLMSTQNFKSEKEVNEFMQKIVGGKIPEFDKLALSFQEQAQDLVFEAYKLPINQGKEKVAEALSLDPTCIEAYEYLAEIEEFPEIASIFLERAIEIGEEKFGDEFIKKNKSHFWLIHETRPYMRCLYNYANCLIIMGMVSEGVEIFEEMIHLNPNDNQGVRDHLLLHLIELEEIDKFKFYDKMFKDDSMAFSSFNRALFSFQTKGAVKQSNELLKKALNSNKFVLPNLISDSFTSGLSDAYSPGSAAEADYYVTHAYNLWREIPGAIDWLKKM